MSETETKTLAQMTAEVVEVNTANGWYENLATFPEATALLHSEVSEALEAWREWGLRDVTVSQPEWDAMRAVIESAEGRESLGPLSKPQGVGSEFADIFIRLLDCAWLFGKIDLEAVTGPGRFGIDDSFPANMNTLHIMIATVFMAQEDEWDTENPRRYVKEFGRVLTFLRQLCEHYGIDLLAEYERKLAYNKTRGYRHGGKRI